MARLSQLALNDEGFAFDPNTGDSFLVNGTGLAILKALRDGSDQAAVVQALTDEYEVTSEDAGRDVDDFLGRLRTFGLA